MNAQQVFYGRGPGGYGILWTDAPEPVYKSVERICQSFGNPGCEEADDDLPTLFQTFFDDRVLMGCGRKGPLDSLGRGTLFYHVIVASAQELRERGISAIDLYRAGLFQSRAPRDSGVSLDLPFETIEAVSRSESKGIKFPAVVSVSRSENLKLIELLGAECVTARWATLSWERLEGFDVYGLDKSRDLTLVPSSRNIYDVEGHGLDIQRSDTRTRESNEAQGSREMPKPPKGARLHGIVWCLLFAIVSFLAGVCVGRQRGVCLQRNIIDDESVSALATVLDSFANKDGKYDGLEKLIRKEPQSKLSVAVRQLRDFLEEQKR